MEKCEEEIFVENNVSSINCEIFNEKILSQCHFIHHKSHMD
jgi:hypothetical protein